MRPKVLRVDDDPSVVAALTGVLRAEGYNVVQALDGQAALKPRCTADGADIVLLDLNMPFKGGWDTFEQLTSINPLLPIIIITAQPDQQSLAAAAGAAALMEKPLEIPLLLETMRKLLAETRIAGKSPHTLHRMTHDAPPEPKINPANQT